MDHFHYKNGIYHAEGISLEALAREIGTPFYCYSSATLERHVQVFAESFGDLDIKVCYAVKANPNIAVIRTLAKCGAGADVVSGGEILQAMAAGVAPSDIVFSGVGKTEDELNFALRENIFQFNVESAPELELLSRLAAAVGKKAPVALRVNPDVDALTHAKITTGTKASKFGIPLGEALALYDRARELEGISVRGVSVHIGSQLTDLAPFEAAFHRVKEFVAALRASGHEITTIDLGGGLGIPYHDDSPPPLPASYAETVRKTFAGEAATLVFEPGRMITGNAGIMVARVTYVKESGGRIFVVLDAGMNDLLRPSFYEAYHGIVPVKEPPANARPVGVDIVGPVCESSDVFARDREMALPRPGDLVAFRTAGAYGASMASTYNARPLVPEVMVRAEEYAIIRPRQSYEDLIGRDRLPKWLD